MGDPDGVSGLLGAVVVSCCLLAASPAAPAFSCLVNPCVYGICVDALNGSYNCYCVDGYTGVNCQTNWDECWSSPCLNGGQCHDGVATFNCTCQDGFAGETCDENVDECISNPCFNNATCIDANNGYVCQCSPGYYGDHCELDVSVCNSSDGERCMNGGLCVDGPGITFKCQCLPGWAGKLCQTAIDECASSPCKNGAVCVDMHATYACACPFGFTGKNCEVIVELCTFNTCENNALCIIEDGHSVCYCVPDYHGDRCQFRYDECQKGPGCLNGGSCIDGVDSYSCSCPTGLTGRFCECVISDGSIDCNHIRPTIGVPTTSSVETEYDSSTTVLVHSTDYEVSSKSGTELFTETVTQGFSTKSVTEEMIDETSPFLEEEWSTRMGTTRWTQTETSTEVDTTYASTTSDEATESWYDVTSASTGTATMERTTIGPPTSHTYVPISYFTRESTDVPGQTTSLYLTPTTEDSGPSAESRTLPPGVTEHTFPFDTPKVSIPWTSTDGAYESTTDGEETSTATALPPGCDQEPCKNGGTCHHTQTGTKCECKFGWTGDKCEEEAGIKIAAFTGDSYLVHTLANTTRGVVVTVTMRSLARSGLVLYARTTPTTYMAVYLQEEHLRFQFSCGIKSMLLSQLYEPVNTGYSLTIMAVLEVIPLMGLERRCSAMLRVNNSLAMSGEQPAVPGPALHNTGALYLGGLPQHILHQVDIPVKNGVIACMYSLQIDGEKKEIYEDAVDGFSVTECSSLACLSSPCLNGGSCVESGHNWHCLCSNGYVGNKCGDSVCKNNPCNFGGTCVQYPGSGFACLCPLGKHGLYCDQDLEIGQPYFSSSIGGLSSYTAYPLPGAIHHSFELRFHFIPSTMDQIALMIFIGQAHPHDPTSDHLAVSFIKGYVVLTWNLGSGPRRIFTPHPVADSGRGKQTHIVRLGRIGQQGWLQVDNMPNITGTSPGWLSQLNTEPILFVGGYESHNFSGLPHDLPLHSGYTGCLYGVELRAGRVRLFPHRSKDAKGRNVGQCSTRHCHDSTCLHGGACLDHAATFSCLCHDGWFGAECSMSSNPCDSTSHNCSQGSTCVPLQSGYECDCPLGKSGKHCEVDEPLSDVSFSGKRSYLSLESVDIDGPEACIDLQLKPMSERGLVLFMQQNQGPTVTFISLSLHGGILELRISPLGGQRRAGDVLVVRSGRVLAMGEWTTVRAGRYGRRVFLSVDGTVNAGNLLPGETLLPGNKPLYIGGVPDLSNLPSGSVAGGLPAPLKGCVRKLRINWQPVALTTTATATTAGPLEGRNLIDCDGTLCGADICHNGGTCQLTPDKKPTCSCQKNFDGERCENLISCMEVGCENSGRCLSMGSTIKCHCPSGWTGSLCDSEVLFGAPHFSGNAYLMVDPASLRGGLAKRGGGSPQEETKPQQQSITPISYIHLNFTTAHSDGMILWTSKDEDYFGVGVEGGLMKVVWGQGEEGQGAVVLLPAAIVSDGAWHSLTLQLQPHGNLTLATDASLAHSYSPFPQVFTDGVFYLGGFPEERSVLDETRGNFKSGFSGCIKEFAWAPDQIGTVTNFTQFESENLGICEMFHP